MANWLVRWLRGLRRLYRRSRTWYLSILMSPVSSSWYISLDVVILTCIREFWIGRWSNLRWCSPSRRISLIGRRRRSSLIRYWNPNYSRSIIVSKRSRSRRRVSISCVWWAMKSGVASSFSMISWRIFKNNILDPCGRWIPRLHKQKRLWRYDYICIRLEVGSSRFFEDG